MQIKTSELIGPALDWAVAKAVGDNRVSLWGSSCWTDNGPHGHGGSGQAYSPSTDWGQCGSIIDAEKMQFTTTLGGDICAWPYGRPLAASIGPTHTVAACRAIVADKLGDSVDVPEGLCHV